MTHIIFATNWDNLKASGDWLGALWPYLLLAGGAIAYIRRVFKKSLKDLVQGEIKPIQDQFKNNGGSTLRDSQDRQERTLKDLTETLTDNTSKLNATATTLAEHTASDSQNFQEILSTLFTLLGGQAGARNTAEEVKRTLDEAAVIIKGDLDASAATVKRAVSDAVEVQDAKDG